jgi:hypothetical protein
MLRDGAGMSIQELMVTTVKIGTLGLRIIRQSELGFLW